MFSAPDPFLASAHRIGEVLMKRWISLSTSAQQQRWPMAAWILRGSFKYNADAKEKRPIRRNPFHIKAGQTVGILGGNRFRQNHPGPAHPPGSMTSPPAVSSRRPGCAEHVAVLRDAVGIVLQKEHPLLRYHPGKTCNGGDGSR